MKSFVYSFVLLALISSIAMAQGVTTGSVSGRVTDAKTGTGLSGATVVVLHVSSGTKYGAIARKNGTFRVSGVRIGSDYRVTATFVGYATAVRDDISVTAGENTDVFISMREAATTTRDVVVTATQDAVFQQSKNGSGTSLSEAEIQATPSINRSLSDIARVNPYATQTTGYGSDDGLQGISIAGANSRYNNVQIDGAVANDMFGLGQAGTAGSQANANVVSMDAIQELQVNVSPYDVRQSGFTGAVVNAVTRSGSNRTSGSVYSYGRNQLFVGRSPDAAKAPYPNFNDVQIGGRIGGAIIPNTLFYHVTAETRQRTRPLELGINNPAMINNFPHTQSEIDEIRTVAREKFGYDAGSSDPFTSRNNTYNILARFDWNVNESNKLQLRYNYTNAFQDRNVQRTSQVFSLASQLNQFRSINHSAVLQWNTQIGNDMANEMRVTYTETSDNRILQSNDFPQVKVYLNGTDYVLFGPERSSQANSLHQVQAAFTNDFSYTTDQHTLSVGTHNELYRFNNLFIQDYFGTYVFRDAAALRDSTPSYYALTYANTAATGGNIQPRATWSMMQSGLYIQDEWKPSSTFAVKAGIRGDIPIYLDTPVQNTQFATVFDSLSNRYSSLNDSLKLLNTAIPGGLSTSRLPDARILWSPRIGFNWDISGEKTLQLRGGTGLFTGKVAAVWLSNQFSNTGVEFSRIVVGNDNGTASPLVGVDGKTPLKVSLDPYNPPKPGDGTFAGSNDRTSAINIMSSSFLPPQVWRSTLALDSRPLNYLTFSLEGMYGQTFNNVDYQNLNLRRSLRLPNSPLDGRPIYAANTSRTSVDSNASKYYTQVLYLSSRDAGYQYSGLVSARLSERNPLLPGLSATISYVLSAAFDVQAATASTASSNWQNTYVTDPNNAEVARSNFDVPHRITANLGYSRKMFDRATTSINFFYSGNSGQPYSFVYFGGDLNGDGVSFNDLIYVPKPEDYNSKIVVVPTGGVDLRTAPQIWQQLMAFIDANETMKSYQGQVLPRNNMRAPFIHSLDMRITQTLPGFAKDNITLSLDVQNVLNLVNSDWGLQQYVNFQSFSLLELKPDVAGNVFDAQGRLRMNFSTPTVNGRPGVYLTDTFFSRWRMQLGLRYSF
jgi:hypothetical protein